MSIDSQPLLQTVTPERWAGFSMSFIDAGYLGLLVKNGQLVRKLEPGRHFSFALPYLEQCQIVLVDGKIRNLDVISQGDFVSRDNYLVNVSLSVMYQVIDPKRVALELSDPIAALVSAVKDQLAVVVNQMRLDQLTRVGRVHIRDYLLSHLDSFYTLGFNLDDVRVSDLSFPQRRGVVRQLEGLTAREEAEHEAVLQTQRASTGTAHLLEQQSLEQQLHPPVLETFVLTPDQRRPPEHTVPIGSASSQKPLPPTTLADAGETARLVNIQTGDAVAIRVTPFTIGREPYNALVSTDDLCSRNHARIERTAKLERGRYLLVDVGSSNGTYLNGQRLVPNQAVGLKGGDRIKIGATEWQFES